VTLKPFDSRETMLDSIFICCDCRIALPYPLVISADTGSAEVESTTSNVRERQSGLPILISFVSRSSWSPKDNACVVQAVISSLKSPLLDLKKLQSANLISSSSDMKLCRLQRMLRCKIVIIHQILFRQMIRVEILKAPEQGA
jgi:hypothetical protein